MAGYVVALQVTSRLDTNTVKLGYTSHGYNGVRCNGPFSIPLPFPYALQQQIRRLYRSPV